MEKRAFYPDLKEWVDVEDPAIEKFYRKAVLWLSTVTMHAELHSKDPNTRVGAAILTPDWAIVSMGYNGFPVGTADDPDVWADREQKYKRVIHAESNAIDFARRDLAGMTLVCNLFPCHLCAGRIAQNGIKTVIYSADPREDLESELATRIMRDAGIELRQVRGIAKVMVPPMFSKQGWDR